MRAWITLFAAAISLAACSDDHGSGVFGPPTESTCPTGSTLTYDNFGKSFMERYCTRCHSSELVGAARKGAPSFHDFDTQPGIKGVADHIDETTAAGPAATNKGMPPDGLRPTMEERLQLGEWIACGVP
ncbi:MAG: c-type cytochrome [Deltaproteobacteria bacterium]|nr:c-type cytochrome [Deltaproteobacteria bacterium]MCW5804458.1 c-type cytochrome [Deltaproteobacteria bacterium]